jgi:copper chaperone CopZ
VYNDYHSEQWLTQQKLWGFSQSERELLPTKLFEFLNISQFHFDEEFVNKKLRTRFFRELYNLADNFNELVYLGNDKEVLEILRELLNLKNNNQNWSKKNANYKDLILLASQTAIRYYKEKYELGQCDECNKAFFRDRLVRTTYNTLRNSNYLCKECVCEIAETIKEVHPISETKSSLSFFCVNCGSEWSRDELLVYVDEHDNKLAHLCPLCYWNEFIPGDIVAEDEKLMQDLHETYEKVDWEPRDRKNYEMIIKGSPVEFAKDIVKDREAAYEKMDQKKEEVEI